MMANGIIAKLMVEKRPQSGLRRFQGLTRSRLMRRSRAKGLVLGAVLALTLTQPFDPRSLAAEIGPPTSQASKPAPQGSTMTESLHLLVGRSIVINLPQRVTRVSIA